VQVFVRAKICPDSYKRGLMNYEILQTKANFPSGEREDFHERKSNGSFKIFYRPKFKLVLLFTF